MEKYIIQKSQKIVSAIYIITDYIKDNDAIKWEIREEALLLISHILMLNTTLPTEKDHSFYLIKNSAQKIISFLDICSTTSILSKMNTQIVTQEIEAFIASLNKLLEEEAHPPGYILSDTFFATDASINDDKRHQNVSILSSRSSRSEDMAKNKDILLKDKKNNRQESIISLLKKDSNLTIKDFKKVITDCSEKTIQRELISLVEKGIIKKVGERRWSKYSLV